MSGRILVADARLTGRIMMAARLAPGAYDLDLCATVSDGLRSAHKKMPDLVLTAEILADGTGFDLAASLRNLPDGKTLSIAMVSDGAVRLAAFKAGFDACLDRICPAEILMARVRNLLQRGAAEADLLRTATTPYGISEATDELSAKPGLIALIAPNIDAGLRWRHALKPLLRDQIIVLDPQRALEELNRSGRPDAVVIGADNRAPVKTLRLISDLRSRAETRHAAILLVQDCTNSTLSVAALDLGITDLVETAFDATEMALRLRRDLARKARRDRYWNALRDGLRLAVTDPLTGLYNRRYAMTQLARITSAHTRGASGFAVMVLDLDRFKSINDTEGHAAGDTVLKVVSQRMSDCVRSCDLLARIGGEEFLIVVQDCDYDAASRAAERLRQVVSERSIYLGKGTSVSVTLSIGMVVCNADGPLTCADAATLFNQADKALYAAKSQGRNRVNLRRSAA